MYLWVVGVVDGVGRTKMGGSWWGGGGNQVMYF